jgi:magnesium transporter
MGVIGIVAFGSINSGLASETDVEHLTYLWRRGGWLWFFFAMSFALILLLVFTSSLDTVLAARSDLSATPFSGIGTRRMTPPAQNAGIWAKAKATWDNTMLWVKEKMEIWTAAKDDKHIAWTLGIGWACCGGGLAGECLVFAKAT